MTEETICLCALNRIFGFDPVTGSTLLKHVGSAEEVFRLDRDSLLSIMGPQSQYPDQITLQARDNAEKELGVLKGAVFIGKGEKGYPELLAECPDAPLGFYLKSSSDACDVFGSRPAIAVVGTRDISPYGQEWCAEIIRSISKTPVKPLIVSGLAYGVDITAHRTALECGLPTVAVMATGIDLVYPARHYRDAHRIALSDGCGLVTDYPPGTRPAALNFLRRNRIIAGLCGATILVESRIKGGGMMTARLAFSYSRDVYALPGRVDDIRSQGCNRLIGERMAEAITDPGSLTEKLGLGKTENRKKRNAAAQIAEFYAERACGERGARLVEIGSVISRNRGISPDGICAATGLSYSEVSCCTGLLESDGFISVDLMGNCIYVWKGA